jgi:hypothetical protein
MKLLVVASALVGLLSAATHLTAEELKLQNKKGKVATTSEFKSAGTVTGTGTGTGTTDAPVHPIHEILSKLTAGLGQAVAQNENLDKNDPLKNLMSLDFLKSHGYGSLAEIDDSFKKALGGANANAGEEPLNIGKMFPPKAVDEILNGLKGGYNDDAHASVDEELSKIFGMEKEKIADFRKRIFDKFSKVSENGDLKVEDIIDVDFRRNLYNDL